ncbi:LCP family protein [Bifidobacterium xylocopae]|uniref:Transcriptional regulator n=1 Tax=Bifidobacterium xylocopae TaxID=2493119 RepID=A0A366KEM1_9BIFI|nr:LCP family protein [Bifidobacterium xylocopae]RBQ00020.1 transcriptional regulator [Bifidobacterium xylocopae]
MNQRGHGQSSPTEEPPSFLPSSSSQQLRRQTRKAKTIQPVRSSTHARKRGGRQSAQEPPAFSPRRSASGPTAPAPRRTVRRSSGSSRQASAPAAPLRAGGRPPATPHAAVSLRRSGGHRARKTLAALLVLILALTAAGCCYGWYWVDHQLKHKDMLTGMDAGPATSWLILGSDERDGTQGTGSSDDTPGFRTDTILVLTKPKRGPASLVSVPRDSLVSLDGQGMKINAVANLSGYPALTGRVEAITGNKIDHTALISFGGLEGVVNAIGGVNLCYDQTVQDPYSGLNWTAGCHDVDGGNALAFSRMRYADPKGDFGRAERQRMVIGAIAQKAASPATLRNPSTDIKLAKAALGAITVDEESNPWTLYHMLLAFRDASSPKGVTGSVYWTDPDYEPDGLGSTVLLNDKRNLDLFGQLAEGRHEPGTVGGM